MDIDDIGFDPVDVNVGVPLVASQGETELVHFASGTEEAGPARDLSSKGSAPAGACKIKRPGWLRAVLRMGALHTRLIIR